MKLLIVNLIHGEYVPYNTNDGENDMVSEDLLMKVYQEMISQGARERVAKMTMNILVTDQHAQEMLEWLKDNKKNIMSDQSAIVKALEITQ